MDKNPMDKKKRNKILLFVLKFAVSGSLLYFVLSKAGIGKVADLLLNINPYAFAFAVAVYISAQLVSSFRWRLMLPGKIKITKLFSLYLLGSFFNTFLPSLVGGDAVKAYYLYRETGKGAQTVASVFMDRYMGFVCLMSIGLLAFPFGLPYFKGTWVAWLLPLVVLLFVLFSVLVLGFRLGQRFKALGDLYEHFHFYIKKKGVIPKALALSAIVQTGTIVSVYVLARGLGIEGASLTVFFVFLPVITTIAALPVSISGIGLREASFVLMFAFVGVSVEAATALSFAWFFSTVAGGLLGIIEYLKHKDYKDIKDPGEQVEA